VKISQFNYFSDIFTCYGLGDYILVSWFFFNFDFFWIIKDIYIIKEFLGKLCVLTNTLKCMGKYVLSSFVLFFFPFFLGFTCFFLFFPRLSSSFFCVFFKIIFVDFFLYWTDWKFSYVVFFFKTLWITTVFSYIVFSFSFFNDFYGAGWKCSFVIFFL